MRELHTYYDNLKVARNAPVEVIRAAYRVLAQRYHPDINTSQDAQRVMQLLNEAWEVLGDKNRRAAHDTWIAQQEELTTNSRPPHFSSSQDRSNAGSARKYSTDSATWEGKQVKPTSSPPRNKANPSPQASSTHEAPRRKGYSLEPGQLDGFSSWLAKANQKTSALVVVGILFGLALLIKSTPAPAPTSQSSSSPLTQTHTPSPPEPLKIGSWKTPQEEFEARVAAREKGTPLPYMLPSQDGQGTATTNDSVPSASPRSAAKEVFGATDPIVQWSPNGRPWPSRAGYIKGMPLRANGGLSKFTVDNSDGGSSVYVKLCRPSQEKCDGLRHVFIPDGSSFTMTDLAPGTYEIRYRSLSTGSMWKSEPLTLRQIEEDRGTRFSVLRLTLYRVTDGNTSFTQLPEERF